jgi:hypothetical protein
MGDAHMVLTPQVAYINAPYGWTGTKELEAAMLKSPIVCQGYCYGKCGKPYHVDYRLGKHLFPKRAEDFERILKSVLKGIAKR